MIINDNGRECLKCGIYKPYSNYYKDRSVTSGYRSTCRECVVQQKSTIEFKLKDSKWRDNKRDNLRANSLIHALREIGIHISKTDYFAMLHDAGDKCSICHEQFLVKPSVDHCHTTMKIRGIICNKCNTALGMFKDSTDTLFRAAQYLKNFDNNPNKYDKYLRDSPAPTDHKRRATIGTKDGIDIKFDSFHKAGLHVGVRSSVIGQAIRKGYIVKGYKWRLAEGEFVEIDRPIYILPSTIELSQEALMYIG